MNKYAYVRFIQDGIKCSVPIEDIKKNEKILKGEWDQSKTFKVKFKDGFFYKANVFYVAETEEMLLKLVETKRIKYTPSKYVSEDTTTESEAGVKITSRKEEKKVSNAEALQKANKENFIDILKEINFNIPLRSEIDLSDNDLKEEIIKLKQNDEKQKQKIIKLEEEVGMLKEKMIKLQSLNANLQEKVLLKWDDLLLHKQTVELPKNEEELPPIEHRLNGQVHLGRGVWLAEHHYDSIDLKGKNPSKFIREMAINLFGTHILSVSSVTGARSNRTKADPKPQLDPQKVMAIKDILRHRLERNGENPQGINNHCDRVPGVIAQKILDLCRAPRQKKIVTPDPEVDTDLKEDEEAVDAEEEIVCFEIEQAEIVLDL